jgi:hypothetical protein
MSINYFPTRNENGVRDLSQSVTLGAYLYNDYHAPAEPPAKAALYPVSLGAIVDVNPGLIQWRRPMPPRMPPICPAFGCGPVSFPVVTYTPPTSSQTSPTPTVNVPPAPPPAAVQVTSGGGTLSPPPAPAGPASGVTQSPGTSTVNVSAPSSVTDQVAGWLSGTTPIFSWNVPNALLAGGVVLGFALLMGGGKKR